MGKICDLCNHMKERNYVESPFFDKKFKIHGHLSHDYVPDVPENTIPWFVYKIKDIPCNKIIVGSTQNPKERWANYKSCCNKRKSNGTGLSKHFMEGCPHDTGPQKQTLNITLIDYYDTTKTKLLKANHVKGPQCRCNECNILKSLEDKWILKLGSFYGKSGLNSRDEVKKKTRGQWSNHPS